MIDIMLESCQTNQRNEFAPEKRGFRIHGHSTSIRLERAFWTVLEEIARASNIPLTQLITRIHDQCASDDHINFASFLRVLSLKYINIYA